MIGQVIYYQLWMLLKLLTHTYMKQKSKRRQLTLQETPSVF